MSRWIRLVLSQHKIDVQYAEVNCSLTRMNLYRSGSHYIRHRHVREEIGTHICHRLLCFNFTYIFLFKVILVPSSCKFQWKMDSKVANWK